MKLKFISDELKGDSPESPDSGKKEASFMLHNLC